MASTRNPSFVNVSGPLSRMPGGIETEPLTLERSPSTLFVRFRGPTLGQDDAAEAARIAAAAIEVAAEPLRRARRGRAPPAPVSYTHLRAHET